mmetsp:Transcript_38673/g.116162  ORF Transcript_38673/g.116162 Transcript_38673/m.116162 type:complete len:320 (-) Transcript_38673:515-1474(-)
MAAAMPANTPATKVSSTDESESASADAFSAVDVTSKTANLVAWNGISFTSNAGRASYTPPIPPSSRTIRPSAAGRDGAKSGSSTTRTRAASKGVRTRAHVATAIALHPSTRRNGFANAAAGPNTSTAARLSISVPPKAIDPARKYPAAVGPNPPAKAMTPSSSTMVAAAATGPPVYFSGWVWRRVLSMSTGVRAVWAKPDAMAPAAKKREYVSKPSVRSFVTGGNRKSFLLFWKRRPARLESIPFPLSMPSSKGSVELIGRRGSIPRGSSTSFRSAASTIGGCGSPVKVMGAAARSPPTPSGSSAGCILSIVAAIRSLG